MIVLAFITGAALASIAWALVASARAREHDAMLGHELNVAVQQERARWRKRVLTIQVDHHEGRRFFHRNLADFDDGLPHTIPSTLPRYVVLQLSRS